MKRQTPVSGCSESQGRVRVEMEQAERCCTILSAACPQRGVAGDTGAERGEEGHLRSQGEESLDGRPG